MPQTASSDDECHRLASCSDSLSIDTVVAFAIVATSCALGKLVNSVICFELSARESAAVNQGLSESLGNVGLESMIHVHRKGYSSQVATLKGVLYASP